MKSKQSILPSDSGFTILEMLVATSLGLLILGLLLASTVSSKNLYQSDVVRTRINQDLRGTLDLIGTQVRVSGENLSRSFPAILVENNFGGGASDRLVLRRNLLDEVLKLCIPLASGTGDDAVFATGAASGCIYSDNTHNFDTWEQYRIDEGPTIDAFIFNSGSKDGEFFEYDGEIDDGLSYAISRGSGGWQNDYDETATALYVLEEWAFDLQNETLRLTVNQDGTPLNVATGITDLQVVAVMQDGSELDTLDADSNWTELRALRITLTGQDTFRGNTIERTLSTEFFPRNVLSN